MTGLGHFIANRWTYGEGEVFSSVDPATGEALWAGRAAGEREVREAVAAARAAFSGWAEAPLAERIRYLEAFGGQIGRHRSELAEAICRDTGKPLWEALSEVASMVGKISVSIEAHNDRCRAALAEVPGGISAMRFKPHGVIAVFSPFNLPGHLANSHVVPALLAGNTVVWKPSELAPLVAERVAELWEAAGLPAGVINMVQGGREAGRVLTAHEDLDGLFFTGSYETGRAIHAAFAGRPEAILVLELGGNNPLVVWEVADLAAAAHLTIQSAFITAGQRCTCARRLIVPEGAEGTAFLDRLLAMTARIRVGRYTDRPEPYMGPVISVQAAERLLAAQAGLARAGGESLRPLEVLEPGSGLLSPGLMDVTAVAERPDVELFGPFLQVIRVKDFASAVAEANRSAYGLSAGLLSDSRSLYEAFSHRIRAGVVNWNRQITGASGYLPFGGVGRSGNHRPSGYYAASYCAYPVASLEINELKMPAQPTPGLE
jgi:succinylglutamic semialdehyde dehydrogenase